MAEVELERLRTLRRRAEVLLQTLVADLTPFRHESIEQGFLRTPDSQSIPNDVNVTTSCSCLMALALTGNTRQFFEDDPEGTAQAIFWKLFDAPWMSSGLAENNAFTTTLVLRTLGFLVEEGTLRRPDMLAATKRWEPQLDIARFKTFARALTSKKKTPVSDLLFSLMPYSVQQNLEQYAASGAHASNTKQEVIKEIGRIVRTTALYEKGRFRNVRLSKATLEALDRDTSAYTAAQQNRLLLDDCYSRAVVPIQRRSIQYVANSITKEPARFGINDYTSSAAVIYWFLDGVYRAKLTLPGSNWETLCKWAAAEFAHQRSLVVAQHAAMMDPVAMAMAACLCAKLRRLSNKGRLGLNSAHQALLPSITELEQSILELFEQQTASGIWPKYFPLFHYQEAGSNFCFTFELLEAVLTEFSDTENRLVANAAFVQGLELAVTWCERNRLQYATRRKGKTKLYTGWNSGGFVRSLQKGQPESWATAVVHMFLWELKEVLSQHIQTRLLAKYASTTPKEALADVLDIQLWFGQGQGHRGLKNTLTNTIIRTFKGHTEHTLRTRKPPKGPLSALLFGPPGTSKTQIAKAIATELGWPLIAIDPSHLLQTSLQNIYVRAEAVFEDISDLSGVVVLFDEMDALVQTRYGKRAIDTEGRFLTTYMLPKLTSLHDRGRIVFLMATNSQEVFDDAIKRAGRFDLLLCMGPPTLRAKCASLHTFYGRDAEPSPQTRMAGRAIWEFSKGDKAIQQQLELYTFGEFKNLISSMGDYGDIGTVLTSRGEADFLSRVRADSATVGLKFRDVEQLLKDHSKQTILGLDSVQIAFTPQQLQKPAIRYLRDRKETKRQ
jgi:hypothetical protein